ncbi:flocculation protein FLO11 [Drosophila elegans]|uniref:flocculation protein FLO11 n=1 Tax=Drosophila elegans TaxID=30023 RepID=UPI0007E8310E|nr:flocculation protein FLO11 [Drosophila elegans]
MNILIWMCLLGCLASVSGIFFDLPEKKNTTGRGDETGGIFSALEEATDTIDGLWQHFKKEILGVLGSFSSGDSGTLPTPISNETSAAPVPPSLPLKSTTDRIITATTTTPTTTESGKKSTEETTTIATPTSTSAP